MYLFHSPRSAVAKLRWLAALCAFSGCLIVNVRDAANTPLGGTAVSYSTNGGSSWTPFLPNGTGSFYLCENTTPPQPPSGTVDFRATKAGYRTIRSRMQLGYAALDAQPPCDSDSAGNAFNLVLHPSPAGWDPGIFKRCVRNADGTTQDATFCPDSGNWDLFINAEIPQMGSTPRVICPGSEATFGNSYRPNTSGSPIFLNWTQTGNGSYKVAAGIDFSLAGYCPNNVCHYPPQCSGGPYWTFFAMGDIPGTQGALYPTLNAAWLHLRMRNAGQYLPSPTAGGAISIAFVMTWNGVDRHVVLAFEPGGAQLYEDSYPNDPKVLQVVNSVDGEVILMSASGWGYPALSDQFAAYDINLTELYNYALSYGIFGGAPQASSITPQVSINLEVREPSTQWVEWDSFRLASN